MKNVSVISITNHLGNDGKWRGVGALYTLPIDEAYDAVKRGLVRLEDDDERAAKAEMKMAEPDGAHVSDPAEGKKGKKR